MAIAEIGMPSAVTNGSSATAKGALRADHEREV
jgi:hypothetical protein